MTALPEYDRLESPGLWRQGEDAQRKEVIICFGDASISLSDQNGVALAHWSLHAIRRVNPNKTPAIFSPDNDETEIIELDDDSMIQAIDTILARIKRQQPKSGRLRWLILGGFTAVMAGLAIFWLPDALVQHTISVVPKATRLEIGRDLLSNIKRVSGQPCSSPSGSAALMALGQRITGTSETRLVMLPAGVKNAAHLPGGYILLNRSVVEGFEEPDVAAGYILAEKIRAKNRDPLEPMLHALGLPSTFRLLTTGNITKSDLVKYAEILLTTAPDPIGADQLLTAFSKTKLRSSPFAYAKDPTGETSFELIEADPFANEAPPILITDGQWISLQRICGE